MHQSSCFILAVVLTFMLLCIAVFAGAYRMKKADNLPVPEGTAPARISEGHDASVPMGEDVKKPLPQSPDTPVPAEIENTRTVVYESVEMRRYEGEDGHPYIHSVTRNDTDKTIVGCLEGKLAFDKDGNPLKIDWWSMDSDLESAYFNLNEDTLYEIAPGEKFDENGGWSLNIMGNDPVVDEIAYVLYCDKEITFEDGTVWENPDFEKWRSAYEGKKIDVEILESYYPYEQEIIF